MNCKHCGSSKHESKKCHIVKWVDYLLTGDENLMPEGRTLVFLQEVTDLK